MTNSSYSTGTYQHNNSPIVVDGGGADEEDTLLLSNNSNGHYNNNNSSAKCNRQAVGVVAVVLVVLVVATAPFHVLFAGRGRQEQAQIFPFTLFASAKLPLRDCTFDECFATNCNAAVAPYTCLFNNGGVHGGCSPVPWVIGTCTEQCDLSNCSELDIPKSTPSCANSPCTKEWCTQPQLCPGDAAPYQCTSGSATFGCSNDPFQWTLKVDDTTCGECCDTSSC